MSDLGRGLHGYLGLVVPSSKYNDITGHQFHNQNIQDY